METITPATDPAILPALLTYMQVPLFLYHRSSVPLLFPGPAPGEVWFRTSRPIPPCATQIQLRLLPVSIPPFPAFRLIRDCHAGRTFWTFVGNPVPRLAPLMIPALETCILSVPLRTTPARSRHLNPFSRFISHPVLALHIPDGESHVTHPATFYIRGGGSILRLVFFVRDPDRWELTYS